MALLWESFPVFFASLYGIFSKIAAKRGYGIYTILFYSLLLCTIVLVPVTDWSIFITFIKDAPLKKHHICIGTFRLYIHTAISFLQHCFTLHGKWQSVYFGRRWRTNSSGRIWLIVFYGSPNHIKPDRFGNYNNRPFTSLHFFEKFDSCKTYNSIDTAHTNIRKESITNSFVKINIWFYE